MVDPTLIQRWISQGQPLTFPEWLALIKAQEQTKVSSRIPNEITQIDRDDQTSHRNGKPPSV